MDNRIIYLLYLVLLTVGAFLSLRVIWALAFQRPARWKSLGIFMAFIGLLAGYYYMESARNLDSLAEARKDYALAAAGPVRIAVAWTEGELAFFAGAQRAIDEINEQPIEVVRRDGTRVPVTLELASFPYKPGEGLSVARKIARDPSIAGVIGHPDIDGAIQASATYDAAGLLYFAPSIRLSQMTQHDFPTVFRLSPSDIEVARAIANFADQNGLFNVVIMSPRNEYGYDLFQIYRGAISALNTSQAQADAPHVRKFISYAPDIHRFDEIITGFIDTATKEKLRVDLVVLLGTSSAEAKLLEQMRRRNLRAAVLCLPDLQDEAVTLVRQTPDSTAGDIYVLSFGEHLEGAYGHRSESASRELLAYDAVHLMADTWAWTGSTLAREAAISLRAVPQWEFGDMLLDFQPSGAVSDVPIRVEKIDPALVGQQHAVGEGSGAIPPPPPSQP